MFRTRAIAILMFFAVICCGYAEAAGPWRGRVIDAETKEPLEGAVVVTSWERVWRTPAGGVPYVYEVKEVLTDKDGRFEVPSYISINILPLLSHIRGPYFIIFKPGYGNFPWYRLYPPMALSNEALRGFFSGETGTEGELRWDYEKLKVTFGVVELPRLKTREERRKSLPSLPSPDRLLEKQTNLIRLMNEEEESLGLQKSDPYEAREFIRKMGK